MLLLQCLLGLLAVGCSHAASQTWCNRRHGHSCGGQQHVLEPAPQGQSPLQSPEVQSAIEGRCIGNILFVDPERQGSHDLLVLECLDDYSFRIEYLERRAPLGGNVTFVHLTGSSNPFHGSEFHLDGESRCVCDESLGQLGAAVADWDRDGNLDVLLVAGNGTLRFWSWDASELSFREQRGEENPLQDVRVPGLYDVQVVDWNTDNRSDLLCSVAQYTDSIVAAARVEYLQGGANGSLIRVDHTQLFFDELSHAVKQQYSDPEGTIFRAADWDGDGDLDILASNRYPKWDWSNDFKLFYFERLRDDSLRQRFSQDNTNPFAAINTETLSAGPYDASFGFRGLQLAPVSPHGFPELVAVARDDWRRTFFAHFQRRAELKPTPRLSRHNPFDSFRFDEGARGGEESMGRDFWEAADTDDDGDYDLLWCNASGLQYFENQGGQFVQQFGPRNPFSALNTKGCRGPKVVDWDGDGLLDLLIGRAAQRGGLIDLFRRSRAGGPWNQTRLLGEDAALHRNVVFEAAEWSGDGSMELLVGAEADAQDESAEAYRLRYFRRHGSGDTLQEVEGVDSPFPHFPGVYNWESGMAAGDLDGDGTLELIMYMPAYRAAGEINVFELKDGKYERQLVWDFFKTSYANVESLLQPGSYYMVPKVMDWDGDGAVDVIVGGDGWLQMWTPGMCEEQLACNGGGTCSAVAHTCQCASSYAGADCSSCAATFYTSSGEAETLRVQRRCSRCRGSDPLSGAVCSRRGICRDDAAARQEGNTSLAQGDGSCLCQDPFSGRDCSRGECPAGTQEEPVAGSPATCRACLAGAFSEANGTCQPCGLGEYSASSSGTCTQCPSGKTTLGVGSNACQIDYDFLVLRGLFFLLSCCFFVCLMLAVPGGVKIEDVRCLGTGVRVKTTTQHFFLKRPWRSARVYLRGTGSFFADERKEPFLVKRVDGCQFDLLDLDGNPAKVRIESSMGYVSVWSPFGRGILSIPLVLLMLAITVGMVGFVVGTDRGWLLEEVAVAMATVGLLYALHTRFAAATTLAALLAEFRVTLPEAVERVPRGPARAITASQLQSLYDCFQSVIRDRSMYYISPNIVKPLTRAAKVSFAELVGPSDLQWFVSHFWGMPFKNFVQAVQRHAMHVGDKSWRSQAYWVCTLSNSQWNVVEEVGNGDWQESSFYKALRSGICKGTCMILDERVEPLKRSWCLFETFQSIILKETDPGFSGLVFCTSSGVLNYGARAYDVAIHISEALAKLNVESACASVQADKDMIDELIRQYEGGFAAVDRFLSASIQESLDAVRKNFEADFRTLSQAFSQPRGLEECP